MDDKTQLRVALEAEAVLGILLGCESGRVKLVSSDVLLAEINRNPHPHKRACVSSLLTSSTETIALSDAIEARALVLEARGFKGFDALHIATAEAGHVEYFCTCDDRLIKKAKAQPDVVTKVVSPLELVKELF